MASVTSLDKDLRALRLDKYTPAAANEARSWIEGILGGRLPPGDLIEALKDGVALCKLVNLAIGPPGVKFKQSAMPFVQMENISHFLRACQSPPLNLQEHDMFLTVDLYESKDPAQVLQCLGAFSRAAVAANPSAFPSAIGPRSNRSGLSPQATGPAKSPSPTRGRGMSNTSNTSAGFKGGAPALTASKTGDSSGRWSPTKSPTSSGVSAWSKKELEGSTAPAWSIHQYGYMGGASQGNLGIAFGGRRQITSAGPHVPTLAEKERQRREAEEEEERQRQQMAEEEERRRAELEAEEERARKEEERKWEDEARRAREEERRLADEEKRRWEEEERHWRQTEERRRKEEDAAEARLQQERSQRSSGKSDSRLRGQYLSQYRSEKDGSSPMRPGGDEDYGSRVKELERELELAREREAEYERERQERSRRRGGGGRDLDHGGSTSEDKKARARSRSRPRDKSRPPLAHVPYSERPPSRQDRPSSRQERPASRQESWSVKDESEFQHSQWSQQDDWRASQQSQRPPSRSARPLPTPSPGPASSSPPKVRTHRTGGDGPPVIPVRKHNTGSRPLPDPTAYASSPAPAQQPAPSNRSPHASRTDRYLASNPAPQQAVAHQTYARELAGGTDERDDEDRRRAAAQKGTKAGGWASKSLLEREMENERQRQREWEEAQKDTAKAPRPADGGVDGIGGGVGGRWDVGQWSGYTGGDGQNRGNQGIGAGRRQIVGPRPLPGSRS